MDIWMPICVTYHRQPALAKGLNLMISCGLIQPPPFCDSMWFCNFIQIKKKIVFTFTKSGDCVFIYIGILWIHLYKCQNLMWVNLHYECRKLTTGRNIHMLFFHKFFIIYVQTWIFSDFSEFFFFWSLIKSWYFLGTFLHNWLVIQEYR